MQWLLSSTCVLWAAMTLSSVPEDAGRSDPEFLYQARCQAVPWQLQVPVSFVWPCSLSSAQIPQQCTEMCQHSVVTLLAIRQMYRRAHLRSFEGTCSSSITGTAMLTLYAAGRMAACVYCL